MGSEMCIRDSTVREINPVNLLKAQKVAVTADAFKKIEEWIDA